MLIKQLSFLLKITSTFSLVKSCITPNDARHASKHNIFFYYYYSRIDENYPMRANPKCRIGSRHY